MESEKIISTYKNEIACKTDTKQSKYKYTNFEQVPVVVHADQLAAILGIARSGAYQLLNRKDFPTVHIGKRKVVPRDLLIKWLENQAAS